MIWMLRHDRRLPLDRPVVMGILNLTPDSFSDGGRLATPADAVAEARRMVAEGKPLPPLRITESGPPSLPPAPPLPVKERPAGGLEGLTPRLA